MIDISTDGTRLDIELDEPIPTGTLTVEVGISGRAEPLSVHGVVRHQRVVPRRPTIVGLELDPLNTSQRSLLVSLLAGLDTPS